MLLEGDVIDSLNSTAIVFVLVDKIGITSSGDALSRAMALCIVIVLPRMSVTVPGCSTNGIAPVPNETCIVIMTIVSLKISTERIPLGGFESKDTR